MFNYTYSIAAFCILYSFTYIHSAFNLTILSFWLFRDTGYVYEYTINKCFVLFIQYVARWASLNSIANCMEAAELETQSNHKCSERAEAS